MKDCQCLEHLVDTGDTRHAVLAQHRVDYVVRANQGPGMAKCGTAGSLGPANLEHDNRFFSVRGALASLHKSRGSLDLFGEAANNPRLVLFDKVANVVG